MYQQDWVLDHHDLLDIGEACAPNTVAKLMHKCGLRALGGYKRRPSKYGVKPSILAANQLQQNFDAAALDIAWVADSTYIKTHEGWLFLAVVIDLYSRRVVGWSMDGRMPISLALNALLMAVRRRKPKAKVIVHSDQGSQFTSAEWQSFLTAHNLEASMSWRGNCCDNAVAKASSTCPKQSGSGAKPTKCGSSHAKTCSIISKCSIIRSANMVIAGCFHPPNLRWQQNEGTRCL